MGETVPEHSEGRGLWSFKVKPDVFPDWHVQPDGADAVTDEERAIRLDALAFKRMAFREHAESWGDGPRSGRSRARRRGEDGPKAVCGG